jgi:hypothetical protein
MVTWAEFSRAAPGIAEAGRAQLFQFGVGLAFLATVRRDGAPRVHPVCPVLAGERLYVLIRPASPKRQDLVRDGRYALQAFPQPRGGSDEFSIAGRAEPIGDPAVRAAVFREAKHQATEDEIPFELRIDRALHTRWEDFRTPRMRPVRRTWRAPGPDRRVARAGPSGRAQRKGPTGGWVERARPEGPARDRTRRSAHRLDSGIPD